MVPEGQCNSSQETQMSNNKPFAYVWQEFQRTPDTQDGPGDVIDELCFDTEPPTEGTPYMNLYEAPTHVWCVYNKAFQLFYFTEEAARKAMSGFPGSLAPMMCRVDLLDVPSRGGV